MRELNTTISVNKLMQVEVNEIVIAEDIIEIIENKVDRIIQVSTVYLNTNNEQVKRFNHEIMGLHYDLLMSESPDFAPNKPRNEYREVDLWYVIDLIRDSE